MIDPTCTLCFVCMRVISVCCLTMQEIDKGQFVKRTTNRSHSCQIGGGKFFALLTACFLLSGATKPVYAPEPFDVGRILQADVISDGQTLTLTTTGPVDPGWSTSWSS